MPPIDKAIRPREKNMNINAPKKRLVLNLKGYEIASAKSPKPNPSVTAAEVNSAFRWLFSSSLFNLHIPPHVLQTATLEPNLFTHSPQAGREQDKHTNFEGRS